MQTIELEFVDNEITAYGGLAILKKMIDSTGFEQALGQCRIVKGKKDKNR